VDDIKFSAVSEDELTKVIGGLKEHFKEITVHEEDSHDYLGMIMMHDVKDQMVTIDMRKYISECVDKFQDQEPDEKIKTVNTPATDNLFKTRNAEKISKRRSKISHSTVAKLLFVAKRARPDILLTVSFLTTRVKEADGDDWKKLLCLLGYLKSTDGLLLHLSCTDLMNLIWYIDGSYATHDDMRRQSGAVLLAGDCAVLFRSNKQKVNTRSSTESEVIAVDDALPTVQWTKNFMMDKGFDLETLIKEDNQSMMLLMKNSKLSSGKWTKHIDLRLYALIWQYLSQESMAEVKRHTDYEVIKTNQDMQRLWKIIEETHKVFTVSCIASGIKKTARKEYQLMHQGAYESIITCKEHFDKVTKCLRHINIWKMPSSLNPI